MATVGSNKCRIIFKLGCGIGITGLIVVLMTLMTTIATDDDQTCILCSASFSYEMYDVTNGSDVNTEAAITVERKLPDFYILGVRQTGSEVISGILALHPEIVLLNNTDFFRKEDKYELGLEWYRSQMPLLRSNAILLEDAADLLIESKVPPRILLTNPDAAFVLVLCQPLKRIIMDYLHIREYALQNPHSEYHFQESDSTLTDLLLNRDLINYVYPGLYRSKYSKFLRSWLDNYSLSNFFIVDSGDFEIKNPFESLQKMESFLGISAFYKTEDFAYNASDSRWCHARLRCSNWRDGTANLTEYTANKINTYFKTYNEDLYDITGVKFDWD